MRKGGKDMRQFLGLLIDLKAVEISIVRREMMRQAETEI